MIKKHLKRIGLIFSFCLIITIAVGTSVNSNANNNNTTTTPEETTTSSDEDLTASDFSMSDLKYNLRTAKLIELKSVSKLREYIDKQEASNSTPKSCDNSSSEYFPPVGNQGSVGSCNSWAAVYYQMTYTVNKELDRPSNTSANIMSPTFIYTLTNKGIDKGSNYTDVLKTLSDIGAVPTTTVPIVSTDDEEKLRTVYANNKDIYMEASKYRVKEYYTIGTANNTNPGLTEYTDEDIKSIKKALAMGEILTMTSYPERWNITKLQQKYNRDFANEEIITEVSGTDNGSHRMAIVGFNDNICIDINGNEKIEPSEKGAFKIANSWGKSWGNDGFIWMSYDAIRINSKANTSEDKERTTGFFNIVGYNVDVNNSDDKSYLVVDLQTIDLQSVELVIYATDPDNVKHTYSPAPFTNAMTYGGLGPYPFSSEDNGNTGQIFIDLSKIDPNITKDNINEYNWSFQFTDTSKEHYVFVNDLKFYFKSDDTYSDSLNNSAITLFNFSRHINITNNYWNLFF